MRIPRADTRVDSRRRPPPAGTTGARPLAVPRRQRGLVGQLIRFGASGIASTLAYLALYELLRGAFGAQPANLLALLVTAVANTVANRRLTFGLSGHADAGRAQVQGLLVFGLGLALTSGSLA